MKNLKLFKGNSGNLGDYGYTYDANSDITAVSLTSDSLGSKTVSYTYDALNRLTSETLRDGTLIEYTYDAVGNRLTKKVTQGGNVTTTNYSYDDANQLTSARGTNYTNDFNGNMTSDGSRNFEYDADNRLIRVTNVSDGSLVASFEYDGFGRRTSKKTPAGTTKYYYDGDSNRVFYEMDGSGNLLVQYPLMGNTGLPYDERQPWHSIELFPQTVPVQPLSVAILFRLDGIFVDVLKNVAMRVPPLTEIDTLEMMDEIKGKKALEGVRGRPPVDKKALSQVLLRLSMLASDFPQIAEMDINPLLAYPGGVAAADAVIVLK